MTEVSNAGLVGHRRQVVIAKMSAVELERALEAGVLEAEQMAVLVGRLDDLGTLCHLEISHRSSGKLTGPWSTVPRLPSRPCPPTSPGPHAC